MGAKVFDYPKPVDMLMRLCEMGTDAENEDIVLDFFSGSGSMGHAVMQQNVKDEGNRKFIMVQLPEKVKEDGDAKKAGYNTIDEIGIERISRAANLLREENPDSEADLGFKLYNLNSLSEEALDKLKTFDNSGFTTDFSVFDEYGINTILTTWLINDGYRFTNTMQEIKLGDYLAYWCENHLYFINPNINEEAIKALIDKYNEEGDFNPQNIVVFGYNFSYVDLENLKTNIKILKDSEKNLKVNLDIRY